MDIFTTASEMRDFITPTPLCKIMEENGSDKGSTKEQSHHNYTKFYHRLFQPIRNKNINLFELGLGSANPSIPSFMVNGTPSASVRGWREYFPNATIYGADIDKDILEDEERIHKFYCDQTSPSSISEMWDHDKLVDVLFDVIIDDGLHTLEANSCFFENSFHKLKDDGVYIIEDVLMSDKDRFIDYISNMKEIFPDYNFIFFILENKLNTGDNTLILIQKKKQ